MGSRILLTARNFGCDFSRDAVINDKPSLPSCRPVSCSNSSGGSGKGLEGRKRIAASRKNVAKKGVAQIAADAAMAAADEAESRRRIQPLAWAIIHLARPACSRRVQRRPRSYDSEGRKRKKQSHSAMCSKPSDYSKAVGQEWEHVREWVE